MKNIFVVTLSTLVATVVVTLLGILALLLNFLQMLTLVTLPLSSRLFRKLNLFIAFVFWRFCVFLFENFYKVEVVFSGDSTPPGENVILFCNHQQMPDIFSLMPLALRNGRLAHLKWFAKDPIKYVPGVGWGMLFLDCIFLKRDWTEDAAKVRKTFANLMKHELPYWLISFSEGTRITPQKLKRSQEFAARTGLPHLENVLIPRTRGFVTSVGALRARTDAVYDVTIGYEPGIPTLWDFLRGKLKRVHLHVQRFPIKEIPSDEKALADWLLTQFQKKDQMMGNFRKMGRLI